MLRDRREFKVNVFADNGRGMISCERREDDDMCICMYLYSVVLFTRLSILLIRAMYVARCRCVDSSPDYSCNLPDKNDFHRSSNVS